MLFLALLSSFGFGNWEVIDTIYDQVQHPFKIHMSEGCVYVMSNREGSITKYRIDKYNNLEFEKKIAIKGEGPGELHQPGLFDSESSLLVVKDANGISFFHDVGRFEKRMRYFSRVIAISVNGGTAGILSLSPRREFVFERYSADAQWLGADHLNIFSHFGEVNPAIDLSELAILSEGDIHSGKSGQFFVSHYFGKIFLIEGSSDVRVVDIASSFAPLGTDIQKLNQKNLMEGFEMVDGGFSLYPLCLTSTMAGDELLVPFSPIRYKDPFDVEIEDAYISVFDSGDFSLVKQLNVPSEHRDGYYGFTATKTDAGDYLAFAITFVDGEMSVVKVLFSDQEQ